MTTEWREIKSNENNIKDVLCCLFVNFDLKQLFFDVRFKKCRKFFIRVNARSLEMILLHLIDIFDILANASEAK